MSRKQIVRFAMLAVLGLGLSLTRISTPVAAAAANLSRSYKSTSAITAGSLVSLVAQRSGFVTPANANNANHLLGVAVAADDSLLAVNESSSTIQVALSGVANTLVSTLNGSITTGDSIAVSALDGVGMKAAPGSEMIGIAQNSLNKQASTTTTRQITDKAGHEHTIMIGYVPVAIAISVVPSGNSGTHSVVGGAQGLAEDIVGHPVSVLSVVISGIVALLTLIAVITLVYGTIRGSILSVGRNPLAKPAIFESMAQVMAMAALITVAAILIIFFLLH